MSDPPCVGDCSDRTLGVHHVSQQEGNAVEPPQGWIVALATNRATLSALLNEKQGPRENCQKVQGGSGGDGHGKELLCPRPGADGFRFEPANRVPVTLRATGTGFRFTRAAREPGSRFANRFTKPAWVPSRPVLTGDIRANYIRTGAQGL